jgi:hypothetical protein
MLNYNHHDKAVNRTSVINLSPDDGNPTRCASSLRSTVPVYKKVNVEELSNDGVQQHTDGRSRQLRQTGTARADLLVSQPVVDVLSGLLQPRPLLLQQPENIAASRDPLLDGGCPQWW